MSSGKPTKRSGNTESNVKKIPKVAPVPRTIDVDDEIRQFIGVDREMLNDVQKASYDQFMEASRSIQYNPFSQNALMVHHHGIPNNPQYFQFAVEKSTEKMKSNSAVVSTSFVSMVREMHQKMLAACENAVNSVQRDAIQQEIVKFENPRFQQYFENNMKLLKMNATFVPKCNMELAELLDKFRAKNRGCKFVAPNEIPVVTNPASLSSLSDINYCYSVQLIESLLVSMTEEDFTDLLKRDKRCCMRGDTCTGKIIYNKFNLHVTNNVENITMYRMRPYEMLSLNTWEGENPYYDCFFCVHDLFWKAAKDNVTAVRPQSIVHTTPFVRMSEGDPTAFPKHLCATRENPWLKNVANVAHPILISNIADHFSYQKTGFKFNGSRFL